MNEEEKEAIKYFYNLRATIDESNMLFDEDINVKCGKETIKQITAVLNLLEKKDEWINKLETKLMYALTPTKHELAKRTQEEFKRVIRENIDEDTDTIKRKLKEEWNNL